MMNHFSFKWRWVSRPMLWMYRREWVWRNFSLFALVGGFSLGGIMAILSNGALMPF